MLPFEPCFSKPPPPSPAATQESVRSTLLKQQDVMAEFLLFQEELSRESLRLKLLMRCVRLRYSTMCVRYQHLVSTPSLRAYPRQLVAGELLAGECGEAAARQYLTDLLGVAEATRPLLFGRLSGLVAQFNRARWPSELGLDDAEFSFMIGLGGHARGPQRPAVLGEMVLRRGQPGAAPVPGVVVGIEEDATVLVIFSGESQQQRVPQQELVPCPGAAVFLPGPLKSRRRCEEKIEADYDRHDAPWPSAARLLDLARCTVVADDPYAAAVFVALLRKACCVVRVKNRFEGDPVEDISAEELQAEFEAVAELAGQLAFSEGEGPFCESQKDSEFSGDEPPSPRAARPLQRSFYCDVLVNLKVEGPSGAPPHICEIQVSPRESQRGTRERARARARERRDFRTSAKKTSRLLVRLLTSTVAPVRISARPKKVCLSSMWLLKKSEQRAYTILRMKSPEELVDVHVFSDPPIRSSSKSPM